MTSSGIVPSSNELSPPGIPSSVVGVSSCCISSFSANASSPDRCSSVSEISSCGTDFILFSVFTVDISAAKAVVPTLFIHKINRSVQAIHRSLAFFLFTPFPPHIIAYFLYKMIYSSYNVHLQNYHCKSSVAAYIWYQRYMNLTHRIRLSCSFSYFPFTSLFIFYHPNTNG